MAKQIPVRGVRTPRVSDNGVHVLMPMQSDTGEEIELVVPHDLLGHFVDMAASGWNVSAKRMGRPPDHRLTFELQALDLGDITEGEEKGELVLTMRFGEEGSISYDVCQDLACALLDALKARLEPGALATHAGPTH